jgi:hypothetical protein
MSSSRRIDHWMFEEFALPVASLAVYRLLFGGYLLVNVLPRYLWIASFPDAFFNPPIGPTMFLSGFPPAWFFVALSFLVTLASICVLVGHRTRLASFGLAGGLLVGDAWAYSFGKIDHDIMHVLIPPLLAAAGWGDALSMDARARPTSARRAPGWPLALLALLLALAFLMAALGKVRGGWLDPSTQAVYGNMLNNYFGVGRQPLLASMAIGTASPWWEILDVATVLLEAAFLPAIVTLRSFRLVCALACSFHLGVLLLLEISFESVLVAYGAFVNWSLLVEHGRGMIANVEKVLGAVRSWQVVLLAAAVFGVESQIGNPVGRALGLFTTYPRFLVAAAEHGGAWLLSLTYLGSTYTRAIVRRQRARRPRPGSPAG